MSFVAFAANFAGTFPLNFPTPAVQLSVFKDKTPGTGQYPTDTVTETAKGWKGRRRVAVAVRTYSWNRYSKGALKAARDDAQWTAPDGTPLVLWSHLVPVDLAESAGFRVPKGRMAARPGTRQVGRENAATGTVKGRSVVATGRSTGPAAPGATGSFAAGEVVFYLVGTMPAPAAPVAAPVAPVAEGPVDPSVARFRLLNLDDAAPVADDDDDAYDASVERFKRLDLD